MPRGERRRAGEVDLQIRLPVRFTYMHTLCHLPVCLLDGGTLLGVNGVPVMHGKLL